jgi:hypothetical protein
MENVIEGIPNLPDLTHPNELMEFGQKTIISLLIIILLVLFLGLILAILNRSLSRNSSENTIDLLINSYQKLIQGLQHSSLILIILVSSFFICSTLANRYHYWEQEKINQVIQSVSGNRLEQVAPKILYVVKEPYTYDTYINNQLIKVNDVREVNRYLPLSGSDLMVNIDQISGLENKQYKYEVEFDGNYQVINTLKEGVNFFLEITPPYGYSLLQDFKVEQDGKRLEPINSGEYRFSFRLNPQESSKFTLTYKVQGGSRWIYDAGGELIKNFRLQVKANFLKADFASGIAPTEVKTEGKTTIFTWEFVDNVSVLNPFGIFTATETIKNTGIIPRLLLLAPGICLWWLLLLYFSIPLKSKDTVIIMGIFFATILMLTYGSRIIEATLAWKIIGLIILILMWGLGNSKRSSLSIIICTLSGVIIPVFGLLIPYSGLTLTLAAFLSITWLAIDNWYFK